MAAKHSKRTTATRNGTEFHCRRPRTEVVDGKYVCPFHAAVELKGALDADHGDDT
jgi:hypothetical protein